MISHASPQRAMRWTRFVFVGWLGFVLQLTVIAALVELVTVPYPVATTIGVSCAVFHNFMIHRRWTWEDRVVRGEMWLEQIKRFARFSVGAGLISMISNLSVMLFLVELLGVHYVVANAFAVSASAFLNFVWCDRLAFAP